MSKALDFMSCISWSCAVLLHRPAHFHTVLMSGLNISNMAF